MNAKSLVFLGLILMIVGTGLLFLLNFFQIGLEGLIVAIMGFILQLVGLSCFVAGLILLIYFRFKNVKVEARK